MEFEEVEVESLNPEERAAWDKAQAKHKRRMMSMLVFCLILAVPIGIGAYKLLKLNRHLKQAETWAVAELTKADPDPMAYGVLGSLRLDQGKLVEALPLLAKAVALESARGDSGQDHLTYAKANIDGLKKQVSGASREEALKALAGAKELATKLPQGRAAATFHGAGILYKAMGEKDLGIASLKEACRLQPDDWVDEGNGKRYKRQQISGAYAKDLAAAQMDQPKE